MQENGTDNLNLAQRTLLAAVSVYRALLSPALALMCGPHAGCRHTPTCSVYFAGAVRLHGACRGTWLGLRRLSRCQPWGTSGFDPVPPRPENSRKSVTQPLTAP